MGPAPPRGTLPDDPLGEEWDILGALSERREPDLDHRKVGIELGRERAASDSLLQTAVCARHQTDVGGHRRLPAPRRCGRRRPQDVQQPTLKGRRQLLDPVEEEGAPIRLPEEAPSASDNARKVADPVTGEERCFDAILNLLAVADDHGPVPPATVGV
ncbi:MAG: hypothetical protein P8188_02550 [Gemmatimonadota bacterium]